MKAGVGMIVMSKMYSAIFSYMSELEEYPVGLYDEKLSIQQNVYRFQEFVKNMNNQRNENLFGEQKEIHKQIQSLNEKRKEEGLEETTNELTVIDAMNSERNETTEDDDDLFNFKSKMTK